MVNPNEMSTYGGITPRSTPAMTLAGAARASGAGSERTRRGRAWCMARIVRRAERICNHRSDIQRLYVTPIISL